jgi:hypothetical protein
MSVSRPVRILIMATLLIPHGVANAAQGVCDNLAGLIRAGAADGDGNGAPFGQFISMATRSHGFIAVDNSGGADVNAALGARHPTSTLVGAIRKQAAKSDAIEPRVYWFGHSGLGMVLSAGTFPGCPLDTVFFKVTAGQAEIVPAPDFVISGDACDTLAIWATTIGGKPVLVQQDDTRGASAEHLTLVPWNSNEWGTPCGMTLIYLMRFKDVAAFCRKDLDCARMNTMARGVSGRYRHDLDAGLSILKDGAAGDVPGPLATAAGRASAVADLPTFGQDEGVAVAETQPDGTASGAKAERSPQPTLVRETTGFLLTDHGYTSPEPPKLAPQQEIIMSILPGIHYRHHYLYPVALDGTAGLGGIGLGVIGVSTATAHPVLIGGFLISIWIQVGGRLEPLAGFETSAVRARVVSVSVDKSL